MFLTAMLAVTLAFGLVLTGCPTDSGGETPDVKKSFTLKGELIDLQVGVGVNPQKVVVYDNPDFKGSPLGEGEIGGSAISPSVLAGRSVGGVSRSIGAVNPYGNDNTHWEIPLTNIDPNDSPQLYFAVTGRGMENAPFMYTLDDFNLPVTGINDGDNYDINTGIPSNNPFNDGIEIECTHFDGTVKITGISSGSWPAEGEDWGDLPKFATVGCFMIFDARGAEIGRMFFNDYPRPENELWTEEEISIYSDNYWTEFPPKPTAGVTIQREKDIVAVRGIVPARPGTLHFDVAFGSDETGWTRARLTTFNTYTLTLENMLDGEVLKEIQNVDFGTGNIAGVTIPNIFGGQ
ncbi:hypothetical protein AGMMS50293_09810 [Spirochaetia bacterium]|nr:hypothetical protein AGMMS50293_09810 [Spirochaetia bacterium]